MNLKSLIVNIHWIPVIVMTLSSFVLGALWHTKYLFGRAWAREINPDKKPIVMNFKLIFGGTALAHFVAIASLSAILSGTGALHGFLTGLLISGMWILPAMTGTYLFANRSLKLLAIDAGMYLLLFSVTGLVMGIW